MLPWIIVFVVFDLIVTFLVLRHVLARRAAAGKAAVDGDGTAAAIPDFRKLREFTDAIHPRIGEIVRANWSGDSLALPGVLGVAIAEADRVSRERGLPLDRDILKKLVENSLAKHGVGSGSQIREALRQVA